MSKCTVTKMTEPEKFVPAKVEIICETQQELDMLGAIFNHSVVCPDIFDEVYKAIELNGGKIACGELDKRLEAKYGSK